MKLFQKHLLLTVLCIVFISTPTFAQFNHFNFILKRIDDIAFYAHPANTRIKGKSLVTDRGSYVDVDIMYREGFTKIRLIKSDVFFSDMYVVSDTDDWPAFYAIGNMKNMAITMVQQQNIKNPKSATELERYLLAHIKEWDGLQVAKFCLYMKYLGY